MEDNSKPLVRLEGREPIFSSQTNRINLIFWPSVIVTLFLLGIALTLIVAIVRNHG